MNKYLTLLSWGADGWLDDIAYGVFITVSLALATLPFGLSLANNGLDGLKKGPRLARGLTVLHGKSTHPAVAEALGIQFGDPYKAWKQ